MTQAKDVDSHVKTIIGELGDIISESLENSLCNLQDFYENLIAILPGHVYWLNREGEYLGCNNLQAKSAGLKSRHEIIGRKNVDLPWNYHAGTLPKELDAINQKVMLTGEALVIEEPGNMLDGSQAIFLSNKVPLKNKKNEVIGMLGISIDITAQKEVQKLKKEKEEAEKLISHMKIVAGSIVHELRTPLACVQLAADLMDKQLSNESVDLTLIASRPKSIKNSVQQINAFITMMLANMKSLSHLDTSQYQLTNMVPIIKDTIEHYPFTQDEEKLIHCSLAHDFEFFGDALLMKNLLVNLIKNSLYYIKVAGKGEIFITLKETAHSHQLLFKDTAKGATKEVTENMFNDFFSQRESGTGLGLAFCKKIMESFGGHIRVHVNSSRKLIPFSNNPANQN